MPDPVYTIDLDHLPSRPMMIPKVDKVNFTATDTVHLDFSPPEGTGTPFNDGIDSFSVGPGNTEKEFSGNAGGNYHFKATPDGGPTTTGDIDVAASR